MTSKEIDKIIDGDYKTSIGDAIISDTEKRNFEFGLKTQAESEFVVLTEEKRRIHESDLPSNEKQYKLTAINIKLEEKKSQLIGLKGLISQTQIKLAGHLNNLNKVTNRINSEIWSYLNQKISLEYNLSSHETNVDARYIQLEINSLKMQMTNLQELRGEITKEQKQVIQSDLSEEKENLQANKEFYSDRLKEEQSELSEHIGKGEPVHSVQAEPLYAQYKDVDIIEKRTEIEKVYGSIEGFSIENLLEKDPAVAMGNLKQLEETLYKNTVHMARSIPVSQTIETQPTVEADFTQSRPVTNPDIELTQNTVIRHDTSGLVSMWAISLDKDEADFKMGDFYSMIEPVTDEQGNITREDVLIATSIDGARKSIISPTGRRFEFEGNEFGFDNVSYNSETNKFYCVNGDEGLGLEVPATKQDIQMLEDRLGVSMFINREKNNYTTLEQQFLDARYRNTEESKLTDLRDRMHSSRTMVEEGTKNLATLFPKPDIQKIDTKTGEYIMDATVSSESKGM